ncbi:hypothetical protein [Sporosarcina sp.]|uniref:hypothetical protein n=1 Tax=Sporosarcina sp. TaxID=49982 RepID=UPI00262212B0|nr:hypothetical protein [Sporosarcina sp.]
MKLARNLFMMFIIFAGLLLSACSEEKKETEDKSEVKNPEEEVVIIPLLSDEAFFEDLHSRLLNEGFKVSEPLKADPKLFGAESGMTLQINEEKLMPLHVYKFADSDERLSQVDETGYLHVITETKNERIAAKRKNSFIIYLHKGHPNYDQVMEILDDL